jgi:serine/threonine protein kinase
MISEGSAVRAPLDCPTLEGWQALFGDLLPPAERERYERHLESCSLCQERLDRLDDLAEALQAARCAGDPTVNPPDPTLSEMVAQLHALNSPVRAAAAEPPELYFLTPSDRPDLLGTLGDYEVQEVIGQGGMGVVLKAFEPALHRHVAIKVLSPALAGSALARLRFTREAKAAAAVSHDHVVVVHGVHEADGLPYLVMEYIAGESLQDRIDRSGPLELTDNVRIAYQTASGLAAAHAQGLIHRDIKPANLLLENGLARVTITDFGLARTGDDAALTQQGAITGTPEFMAPEQACAAVIDRRADLFSLGSVMYAMCTGRPPFRGSTPLAVLREVCEADPTPIRALNPDVPAWLERLTFRLMAKNPDHRFQNATEVVALLEGYLAHLRQPTTVPIPPLPPAPLDLHRGRPSMQPRSSHRLWFLASVAAAGLLALSAAIAVGMFGSKDGAAADLGQKRGAVAADKSNLPQAPIPVLEPASGLVCLLVNKNSGRCLSVGGAANPGAWVVQGPTPEQASAEERWTLLAVGNAFRLRNQSSGLVLEIGGGNCDPGVGAIQWHDQLTIPSQHWLFERVEDTYVLRAVHSQLVLGIGQASHDAGARAVQWHAMPGVLDQCWELRPAYPQEVFWALKGKPEKGPPLELIGPDAESCVRFEADGLRIVMPPGQPEEGPLVGVSANVAVQGDYEITVRFEILHEPDHSDGAHRPMRLWLTAHVDDDHDSHALISRIQWKDGRPQYGMWHRLWNKDTETSPVIGKQVLTDAKAGSLRLVRVGAKLHYAAADGARPEFARLHELPFTDAPLKGVRLVCGTGGRDSSLDVRFTDLHIRAAALPQLSRPEAATGRQPDAAVPEMARSLAEHGWLATASAIALAVAVLFAATAAVTLHRRRKAPPPDLTERPAGSDAALARVALTCASCGKKLKAKAELAGKKAKCPGCGAAIRVAAAGAQVDGNA